jgi:cytochrome c peroxidase
MTRVTKLSRHPGEWLTVVFIILIASSSTLRSDEPHAAEGGAHWELRHQCPPSFEKISNGTCVFRSLYQLYSAPAHHGGLRVPLPAHRDGFTPEQIDLGRYLFFDPLLSRDRSMACASCHDPHHGFSLGRLTRMGTEDNIASNRERVGGKELARAVPTLWNVGFSPVLFWDGRARSLEEQALGPLFSADEMGTTPATLANAVNSSVVYRDLFSVAFQRSVQQLITVQEIVTALAAFETSLVSFNSRYDRYAHGQTNALTATEVAGFNIFRGFVARCSQCHVPPLFTDNEVAVVGAPAGRQGQVDLGAGAISRDPSLIGGFRVPTLRNVALTAPYFNAGQFSSLKEVVQFYNGGRGHAVPRGVKEMIHWHIAMPKATLCESEINELVAFMGALTDESMMPAIPATLPSGLKAASRGQRDNSLSIGTSVVQPPARLQDRYASNH